MNKPARFTQAELSRVLRAAKAVGARVTICDGKIEIDFNTDRTGQELKDDDDPFTPPPGFAL